MSSVLLAALNHVKTHMALSIGRHPSPIPVENEWLPVALSLRIDAWKPLLQCVVFLSPMLIFDRGIWNKDEDLSFFVGVAVMMNLHLEERNNMKYESAHKKRN